jgi:hypothetical protein
VDDDAAVVKLEQKRSLLINRTLFEKTKRAFNYCGESALSVFIDHR